jgi:hypothetical protein
MKQVIFAVSFGLCIVPVTLCFVGAAFLHAAATGISMPQFHISTCALPGLLSGVLWNAGNMYE